jgi:hypothetical protein
MFKEHHRFRLADATALRIRPTGTGSFVGIGVAALVEIALTR